MKFFNPIKKIGHQINNLKARFCQSDEVLFWQDESAAEKRSLST
jgi:hypothetical protein